MNGESVRILVVDDEVGIREGCRRVLASEGYEVETAPDGPSALDMVRESGHFSAALIDLKMPGMGGIELLQRLRERDPDILPIVITAYATIDTAVEATKRGAYGYVPKPFTPDELLLPVRNGLEKRALSLEARRLREERERRLLEVAFERSQSNTILNCMTDGVVVINRDRQLVLRNAAAGRILAPCADLPLPAPADESLGCSELRDLLFQALGAGPGPVIVSREIGLGESTYLASAGPVTDPGGEPLGAVAVLRDITALKKLDTAKSMFVSMVAHEVKRPLGIIEGYLDLILSGLTGEDPRRDAEMMRKALARARALRTMVSELMNLTAIETGHFNLTRRPLHLDAVAGEVARSYADKARQKEIELRIECAPGSADEQVLADRDAMAIVFGNLIDNAVKYTPQRGHVVVRVRREGSRLSATVEDDGIGMAPEEKDKAFEEFFRGRNEYTAQVPGTGLGLALVKRIVELHQGNVTLETAPGRGSKFIVSLPIAAQAGRDSP